MRYSQTSLENNEIEANENNPLLKTEDPSKTTEDGQKVADGYEYVDAPEAIEGENQKPDDVIEEGEVLNKVTAIDNIVKENEKTSDTIQAMATVANEMYAIIEEKGKLDLSEMMMVNMAFKSFESHSPWLKEHTGEIASLESYSQSGLQYSASQVSLEGVFTAIGAGVRKLLAGISLLIKNGAGLASTMSGVTAKRIARAKELQRSIDNSHREGGLKTVGGRFIGQLTVDGKTPDAATVIKTANYLTTCVDECLSASSFDMATRHSKDAVKALLDNVKLGKNKDRPSGWWIFWVVFLCGPAFGRAAGLAIWAIDKHTFPRTIRMDPSYSPQLFKLYPNCSKVNDANASAVGLVAKRSLPLFGNRNIVVQQYSDTVPTERVGRDHSPSLTLNTTGKGGGDKEIQVLTGAQQTAVLANAIKLLEASKSYFDSYAARNKAFYDAYCRNINEGLAWRDKNGKTPYGAGLISSSTGWYTKVFWNGIFRGQSNIARYASNTANALLDLVEASGKLAKANVASTETYNPFLDTSDPEANPFL